MDTFSMNSMLDALNSGNVIPTNDFKHHPLNEVSFYIGDIEYEIGSGMNLGNNVIKVRYRGNLTPLYKNNDSYYISVFRGKDNEQRPIFQEIYGKIDKRSEMFIPFQSKSNSKRKMDVDTVTSNKRKGTVERKLKALSEHDQVLKKQEQDRNDRIKYSKQVEKANRDQRETAALGLSGLFSKLNNNFGKKKSIIKRLMSDLKSLHNIK